jgi:hypothetical protein
MSEKAASEEDLNKFIEALQAAAAAYQEKAPPDIGKKAEDAVSVASGFLRSIK